MIDLALDNRILLNNDFDLAIQEIDMLFNTTNTELLGDTNYGLSLESFLWTLTPTTTELDKYINEKIQQYCVFANKFNVSVQSPYYQGSYRSIYVIYISITDPTTGVTAKRKYHYK